MQEKVIDKDEEQVTEVRTQASEEAIDKRLHERFRINSKVIIRLSDGSIAQAQAVDISMGGNIYRV